MVIAARKDREKRLLEIASAQGGYFTAKQALKAGYSYRLQHYHRSEGYWQDIDRGVFRFADYPDTPFEDLIRWSLWSRNREDIPQAVISHETALTVHELGDVMPGKVHLTVPPRFRKQPPGGCILHRKFLAAEESENRGGFLVTTPRRTIQDVAEGTLALDQLEKAVRDGISRGLTSVQTIQRLSLSKGAKDKLRLILDEIRNHPIF
jgi:predicted transcriptional regulator of viral defense system